MGITKTETLTIKVNPVEKEKIRRLAAEKDWTVSKYLYNLLIKNLEEEENNGKS